MGWRGEDGEDREVRDGEGRGGRSYLESYQDIEIRYLESYQDELPRELSR